MNTLFLIGTSHKYAPVDVRSRLAFAEEEIPRALHDLCREFASEAVIVSTCNRTELYIVPKDDGVDQESLRRWLTNFRDVQVDPGHLFAMTGSAVAHHLMEVASGIDSQVIGDIQIIGQVKSAYLAAREHGTLGKILTRLFETALRAGKRVKTETELFSGAVSISYVAVELARKIFYPLDAQKTLVVGAGETGELTARSLRGRGVKSIAVANRTESRGQDLIERLGFGEWLPMEQMYRELHRFDIIIVATGAREYILDYEAVRKAAAQRSGNTMLVVDLSVPRNVDPRVSEIDNVFCKDLNDLTNVIEVNVERRREEIPQAENIIAEELDELVAWGRMLSVTPVISGLQRQAEAIAREMLEQNKGRFNDDDFRNVEKLVGSVVKKIIGLPMSHLLEAGRDPEGAQRKAEYVRELFNLNGLTEKKERNGAVGKNGAHESGVNRESKTQEKQRVGN